MKSLEEMGYTKFMIYGFWETTDKEMREFKFPDKELRDEMLAICQAENNGYKYKTFERRKICKKERETIAMLKEFAGYDESNLF